MKDIEAIWRALEEWRERTAGDVSVESLGAGWLCRLQAPRRGIAPALCHGVDATTAVEGALAVLALRESASTGAPRSRRSFLPRVVGSSRDGHPFRSTSEHAADAVPAEPFEEAPDSRVTTRAPAGAPWHVRRMAKGR